MSASSDSVVNVKIRIVTAQEGRGRALETFRSLVGQIRPAPGCMSCHLLEDVHQPGDLTLSMEWRTQANLERFVRSPGFPRLLAGIDLAAEEPEIEVRTTSGVRGLDFFENLMRNGSSDGSENRVAKEDDLEVEV